MQGRDLRTAASLIWWWQGVASRALAPPFPAARNGLRVALIQDRPVLGGNGSSEVRVWPEGHTRLQPYPHIGEIVEELTPPKGPGDHNVAGADRFTDQRKLDTARAEPRLTLMMEQRVNAVEMKDGRIAAVVAQHTRTAVRTRVRGKLFANCAGRDGGFSSRSGA